MEPEHQITFGPFRLETTQGRMFGASLGGTMRAGQAGLDCGAFSSI